MANKQHVELLMQGPEAWAQWREAHPSTKPDLRNAVLSRMRLMRMDLRNADLRGASLHEANLYEANLAQADLRGADLEKAILSRTNLREANYTGAIFRRANLNRLNLSGLDFSGMYLWGVNFHGANLINAKLTKANLQHADLRSANLSGADLRGADLTTAMLVNTKLAGANLTGASVYGISAWDLQLDNTEQSNLIITRPNEPVITVDDLEIAQFIHLLLNNQKIRDVIDTIGKKAVLILGRFTKQRMAVLEAIRGELRKHGYLPILFDFEKPGSRDITETVSTLAHLARFVIADITDPKSIPQELMKIVPSLPSVPVQPLLLASKREWAMFRDLRRYPWVLEPVRYKNLSGLLANFEKSVIAPAERKAQEQTASSV
jgi:uncharacterized protein YjbI with pentapeptide repeats